MRAFRFSFSLVALALAPGCSTVHYLWQASAGQLELFNKARPIPEVLKDERTPKRIRDLLAEIGPIKKYGESQGLKPTPNYKEYVKLDRRAAVWVVSASLPLKFEARQWSFPIVGSFPYLGWFDVNDARAYAEDLKKQGLDVDLRGATAYSTLGWFRDPVLSTMIPEGNEALGELVNVILHESTHATIYVNGQSYFNESLASFVADRMAQGYLQASRGPASPELKGYLDDQKASEDAERELHAAYEKLDAIYGSSAPDGEKLAQKAAVLNDIREKLHYRREVNNATLIQYKTYNTGSAELVALYDACGKNWGRFLSALRTLTPASFPKPQAQDLKAVLGPLAAGGCRV